MIDTTDTTATESTDTADQRADDKQSAPQRITTATEFFREKFADADEDEYEELGPFIDPKGDDIEEVRT
jgi:hypothetical protein